MTYKMVTGNAYLQTVPTATQNWKHILKIRIYRVEWKCCCLQALERVWFVQDSTMLALNMLILMRAMNAPSSIPLEFGVSVDR